MFNVVREKKNPVVLLICPFLIFLIMEIFLPLKILNIILYLNVTG